MNVGAKGSFTDEITESASFWTANVVRVFLGESVRISFLEGMDHASLMDLGNSYCGRFGFCSDHCHCRITPSRSSDIKYELSAANSKCKIPCPCFVGGNTSSPVWLFAIASSPVILRNAI